MALLISDSAQAALLYFLYCVRFLVFFVPSYLFGCYHFLMNKDIYYVPLLNVEKYTNVMKV